eukprot:Tbor_TRINITY_DN4427_c0_g1::TRINITY_DN4427_c0_g1_i1::g.8040::m.8040
MSEDSAIEKSIHELRSHYAMRHEARIERKKRVENSFVEHEKTLLRKRLEASKKDLDRLLLKSNVEVVTAKYRRMKSNDAQVDTRERKRQYDEVQQSIHLQLWEKKIRDPVPPEAVEVAKDAYRTPQKRSLINRCTSRT